MKRNEIYTAIALITIILISALWKQELDYRRTLISEMTPPKIEKDEEIDNYNYDDWIDSKLEKKKPRKQSWMKAYRDGIIFNYNPRWNR